MWLFTSHMCLLDFITYNLLQKTTHIWDNGYLRQNWSWEKALSNWKIIFFPMERIGDVCVPCFELRRDGFDANQQVLDIMHFHLQCLHQYSLGAWFTLFHSDETFMWALIGAMAYRRIMSLVITKPSCLICSMYCLISWKMTSLPHISSSDPIEGIPCLYSRDPKPLCNWL